ncbi:MAG: hypothetical protein ACE5GW_03405, partial [Planctomycetota bacterium]
ILGLRSAAASANRASPIYIAPRELGAPRGIETGYRPSNRFPEPWPGGWWRIGDIISYELATARSLLGSLARERRHWLEGALETAERAIAEAGGDAAPQGWLIPPDNRDRGALRRLLGILLAEGIDIEAAAEAFDADEMRYPAGTLILRRDQPYGGFLKDLFEVQRYPDGPSPYDVAGWTLPLLLGVRRVEVVRPFAVRGEEVRSAEEALARLPAPARPAHPWTRLDGDDSDSLRGVIGLLEAAIPVVFDGREDSPGPGAWAIPDDPDDPRRLDRARAIIGDGDRGRILEGTEPLRDPAARVDEGGGAEAAEEQGEEVEEAEEEKEGENATAGARELVRLDRLPRVGLYAPWVASMDEGWTRWVLEAFGLPYRRLRNESIRAGNLRSIVDVLIVPSVPASIVKAGRSEGSIFPRFAGGLDPEGSVAIEEFVRAGGTLIAFDRACDFVIELFALTLENAAAGGRDEKSFRCPGSILRTVPVEGTALTAGLPPSQPVFFSGSRAFRPKEAKGKEAKSKRSAERARALKLEPLLRFPESRILLSGWIRKPEAIAGTTAWGRVKIGKGFVHLFGFRPQYRSWSQVSFRLLFRAILMPDS